MTSESDEAIQIYKVRDGRHDKQLLSKKYGVKLAKFTRNSSSIIYASTKQNGKRPYESLNYFPRKKGMFDTIGLYRRDPVLNNP